MDRTRAAYDTSCAPGWYLSGYIACYACEPGYFCPGGKQVNRDLCPSGTYSFYAQNECTTCPEGYQCTYGNGAMTICGAGQYSHAGSTTCSNCPNGYTCDERGIIAPCPVGMMCVWSNTVYSGRARSCYAGHYCSEGTIETACTNNQYSVYSTTGISACTTVPPGYAWVANNHPPQNCPVGYYQDRASQSEGCVICPTGHFCAGGASAHLRPTTCEVGTFAPIQGLGQCHDCPQGFYCQDPTSWPVKCPYGTYSSDGNYECTPCPAGMQCIGARDDEKAICDDGFYSLQGDGVCTKCPAGYRCHEKHMQPLQCEPGWYADVGAMKCTLCPSGHYCEFSTAAPAICPGGQWAPQGSYQCYECAYGYVCNNAAGDDDALTKVRCATDEMTTMWHDVCYECPAGYACPLQILDEIEMCGPGFYSTTDMEYCQVTQAGYYSPTTQAVPVAVVDGHFAEIGMTYQTRIFPNKMRHTKDGRHSIACRPGQYLKDYVCTNADPGTFAPIAWSVSGHRDAPLACPNGMWALGEAIECHICPPGYDCTNKEIIPTTRCDDGYFQIGGNMGCTICPDGHECNKGETLTPCPLWHYADSSTLGDCLPCPDGYDCTTGVKVGCPAGTYSSAQDFTCNTCPFGYYCPGLSGFPIVCPGGQYSMGGQHTCATCPADYYAEEGNAYCTPVPPGFRINDANDGITVCLHKTYSDWGDTTCTTCRDGWLCPEKTQFYTGELSCPRGSYCIAGVQTLCPAGYFGIKERGTSQNDACSQCPSGYNCIAGTENYLQAPCPLGAYCPNGIYTICPEGTTGDTLYGVSLNDCKTCPTGASCGEGATTSTTCGQAYYCPAGAAAPGYPCPPGTFGGWKTGKTDPSECIVCPPGYYCPEGTADPIPAPIGYYNPLQGIDSEDGLQLCPPKFYCPDEAMTNYLGWHCAPGHYCPAGSTLADEFPCPAGTYSDRVNLHDKTHCDPCPRGFTCAAGTTSSNGNMVECTAGEFCELGSAPLTTAILCPAGTYSPFTKSMSEQDCLPCTPGYYCVKAAASEQQVCPAGYYCPLGTQSATQYPCPQGTYSTQTGLLDVMQCTACGVGNYCASPALAAPTACADGYYNDYDVNAFYCDMCPSGYTCNAGDDHPQPCAEGYYSDRGALACTRCPLGHYCAVKGTTMLQMLEQKCPAGTFCSATVDGLIGGLSTYPNKDSQANGGNACAKFFYCPTGTPTEIAISTLGYETILIEGAGYIDKGTLTPAGYVDQAMTVCPVGHYCPQGTRSTVQAIPCPKGTYRGDTLGMDVVDCGLCPAGYYCASLGTSAPVICPTGKFCPEGSVRPSDCPLGTYNQVEGIKESRECTMCDAGYYCPLLGQSDKDATHTCDRGFVCYGGAFRPEPTDTTTGDICPAGAYCEADTGLNYCDAGTIGIFQGAFEADACKDCEKGFYCFGGDTGAVTCPAGYFCPEGSALYDQDSQKPPPGFYNIAGQEAPTKCALGTFTKVLGQESCTNCEQGYYCHTLGLADPDTDAICPAGHYCPSYDSVTADGSAYQTIMCPAGTYQPDLSMTALSDCLACPAGKACEFKAIASLATDLPDCAAGFFCVSGATSRYPYTLSAGEYGPCPVGHWCDVGTSVPTPCVAGFFSNQERAISIDYCLACPPGFMCEVDGLAEPTGPVSIGVRTLDAILENQTCSAFSSEYCPLGTFIAQQCYTGYYQDVAGQGKCKECPAGQYCLNGSPLNCLAGYYCP